MGLLDNLERDVDLEYLSLRLNFINEELADLVVRKGSAIPLDDLAKMQEAIGILCNVHTSVIRERRLMNLTVKTQNELP